MAEKDIIMANRKELRRLHIIRKVLEKEVKQVKASEILGVGERQVRRIVRRIREEGVKGIVHKSRGRISNRRISKELRERVLKLYRDKYYDFGPTLASEKLFEINRIKISDETLRGWLIADGEWKRRRKDRKHRQWRERKHYFGEMIQIDGSEHNWFEGRGDECVLMGYIDDAASEVFARFYEYEGTMPAMESFKRYIQKYGLPQSIYIDRHSTYKSTAKASIEEELNNTEPMSRFQRALKELGVRVIYARSAQAKGRIERLFRTFQDRVIKEMRLKGIKNIAEANKFLRYYLPKYNKRFRVEAREKGDLHRELPEGIEIDRILCIKTQRSLRNDNTVAHNKKLYQISDKTTAKKVTVEDRIDGRMLITYKGKELRYKEIAARAIRKSEKKPGTFKLKKPYTPPKDHIWRQLNKRLYQHINNYPQREKEAKRETTTAAVLT